jgi:hypothetical protein
VYRQILILANSYKGGSGNRCIAGIDVDTGEWVRPCSGDGTGGISWNERQIDRCEPRILDIVGIPLGDDGPNRMYQPENRQLLKGPWKRSERTVKEVTGLVAGLLQLPNPLLHNTDKKVHIYNLIMLPEEQRKSLCLIPAAVNFYTVARTSKSGYFKGVNASFHCGDDDYDLPVTDYEYHKAFPARSTKQSSCILTISLGLPNTDNCCYKLVAGVIELPES